MLSISSTDLAVFCCIDLSAVTDSFADSDLRVVFGREPTASRPRPRSKSRTNKTTTRQLVILLQCAEEIQTHTKIGTHDSLPQA